MGKELKITLKKSSIRSNKKHKAVLKGLGLTKLNKTVTLKDTREIRGMVNQVIHMVHCEIVP